MQGIFYVKKDKKKAVRFWTAQCLVRRFRTHNGWEGICVPDILYIGNLSRNFNNKKCDYLLTVFSVAEDFGDQGTRFPGEVQNEGGDLWRLL